MAQTNHIRQWGSVPSTSYEINQIDKTVTIKTGSTSIFKFEAYILETGEPGEIDMIQTDDDGAGQVLLMVRGDPSGGRTYGAAVLKGIDLRYDTSVSKLQGVLIRDGLGQPYGISVHQVLNYITVDGDLDGYLSAASGSGDISIGGTSHSYMSFADHMTGAITIGGQMLGNIHATTLGDITVNGVGTHTGDITAGAAYGGTISIAGTYAGDMSFTPSLSGTVTFLGSLSGSLKVDGQLSGQVRINGSLVNGAQTNDVWITTSIAPGGAVVVDYDGWQPNDNWASGAVVRVGDTAYTCDNWAAPVYEITECRGDMNNDGVVSFLDINPFVLALSDPTGYASQYPGLGGSMAWHGDIDCDGAFGLGDINPFVYLLSLPEPPCDPYWNCADDSDGDIERMSSGTLAGALLADVPADRRAQLVTLIAQVIAAQDNGNDQTYWLAVYDALTE